MLPKSNNDGTRRGLRGTNFRVYRPFGAKIDDRALSTASANIGKRPRNWHVASMRDHRPLLRVTLDSRSILRYNLVPFRARNHPKLSYNS